MANTTKDKLTALFTRVKTAHIAFEEAQKQAFERALDAGKAIIEILALRDTLTKTEQAKMGATNWQKYITAETGVPITSAKRYVKIAENVDLASKGFMDGVGLRDLEQYITNGGKTPEPSQANGQAKPVQSSGNGTSVDNPLTSQTLPIGAGAIEGDEDSGETQAESEPDDSSSNDTDEAVVEETFTQDGPTEHKRFVNWRGNVYEPFKNKTVATFDSLETHKAAYELVIRDFQSMLDVIQKAIDNKGNVVSLPRRADTSNKKPEPTTIEELNV